MTDKEKLNLCVEALRRIRDNPRIWRAPIAGGQDQYAGLPPFVRQIDEVFKKIGE